MTEQRFHDVDLSGAEFRHVRMTGATFSRVDLTGARLRAVDLTDADLENVDLRGLRIREADVRDVEIVAWDLERVVINGVDVAPMVQAELDRRDPDRPRMRPSDADGFRDAWTLLERRWEETLARARRLPEEQLHASVDGEWSFIQTLRHLAFATETWLLRAIQGESHPWHPLSLPWDGMQPHPEVPWDREARCSLDEALALRRDRQRAVREHLAGLTEEQLDGQTKPVEGPGYPPADSFPVRECLLTILNEEYLHRTYAERDLARLASD